MDPGNVRPSNDCVPLRSMVSSIACQFFANAGFLHVHAIIANEIFLRAVQGKQLQYYVRIIVHYHAGCVSHEVAATMPAAHYNIRAEWILHGQAATISMQHTSILMQVMRRIIIGLSFRTIPCQEVCVHKNACT